MYETMQITVNNVIKLKFFSIMTNKRGSIYLCHCFGCSVLNSQLLQQCLHRRMAPFYHTVTLWMLWTVLHFAATQVP